MRTGEDTREVLFDIRDNTIIAVGIGETAKETKNIGGVGWILPIRSEDDIVVKASRIEKVTAIQVTLRNTDQAEMTDGIRKIPSVVEQNTMIDETEFGNASTVKRMIMR